MDAFLATLQTLFGLIVQIVQLILQLFIQLFSFILVIAKMIMTALHLG